MQLYNHYVQLYLCVCVWAGKGGGAGLGVVECFIGITVTANMHVLCAPGAANTQGFCVEVFMPYL